MKKTFLFAALAACLSTPALAKDYIHKWCAPEEPAAPVMVAPAPAPQVERINLAADALFQFNRSSVKDLLPQGRATLDDLAARLVSRQAHIDSIALVGHTDRLGSEQYNYNLGLKRAETVKAYLQEKGVQDPISTRSAGETQPVTTDCYGTRATAALKACLQPDRRVVVEITGTTSVAQ